MKATGWIITVLAVVIGIYFVIGNIRADPLDYNLKAHTNLALHDHVDLEIEFLGEPFPVPPNTGISAKGMRVTHTHDGSGKLHVEGPYSHQFYLRDFFTIWGKQFNSTCLFNECIDENYTLEFFVNDQPNKLYEALPLRDDDKIKIVYRKK